MEREIFETGDFFKGLDMFEKLITVIIILIWAWFIHDNVIVQLAKKYRYKSMVVPEILRCQIENTAISSSDVSVKLNATNICLQAPTMKLRRRIPWKHHRNIANTLLILFWHLLANWAITSPWIKHVYIIIALQCETAVRQIHYIMLLTLLGITGCNA